LISTIMKFLKHMHLDVVINIGGAAMHMAADRRRAQRRPQQWIGSQSPPYGPFWMELRILAGAHHGKRAYA
jgi:hypothetical protein